MSAALDISRRGLLGGSIVLAFTLAASGPSPAQTSAEPAPSAAPPLPGSLKQTPMLDAWIRVDADGRITVMTGKAELGQGIKTALIQLAAEGLAVEPAAVGLVTADTARTPNEGYTAGSHSMQDSGTAILNAAFQVRDILVGLAAERLGVAADGLKAADGAIVAPDGRRIGYGALVASDTLHREAQPGVKLPDPATFKVIGHAMGRVDIPAKVTGGPAYIQDMRPDGMVHARVARPPSYGATLVGLEAGPIEALPGVVKVHRDGNYLAVIAEREFQAVLAARALGKAARWRETAHLPKRAELYAYLDALPADEHVIHDVGTHGAAGQAVAANFRRPYQLHGSIGPSCALARFADGKLTVWSHAQGMFPLRGSVAQMLRLPPETVRCIHVEGAGCYGHNGADDAAADAALLAVRALPGRTVRVQFMRPDEQLHEPYGPAMTTRAGAVVTGGRIVDWTYEVRSNTHATRPPDAGNLLPARLLAEPFAEPAPKPLPLPEGGGDRNAIPLYALPNARIVHHFVPAMPLRVSAMRGLGAYMNIFSIESFMDECAAAAGADPVAFRLAHLEDSRARDVITTAAERFGWGAKAGAGRGFGFAFARYKNLGAYAAIAVEVEVDRDTGRVRPVRVVAATDSGQAVNPNGIRNQIEGGIIQSTSWTLFEDVLFDETRIRSRDWSTYPILRFGSVPDSVEVHVIDRPGQPFLGTGEAAQGPTAAALANAVAHATGARLRELPLTPERIKAAIGV